MFRNTVQKLFLHNTKKIKTKSCWTVSLSLSILIPGVQQNFHLTGFPHRVNSFCPGTGLDVFCLQLAGGEGGRGQLRVLLVLLSGLLYEDGGTPVPAPQGADLAGLAEAAW